MSSFIFCTRFGPLSGLTFLSIKPCSCSFLTSLTFVILLLLTNIFSPFGKSLSICISLALDKFGKITSAKYFSTKASYLESVPNNSSIFLPISFVNCFWRASLYFGLVTGGSLPPNALDTISIISSCNLTSNPKSFLKDSSFCFNAFSCCSLFSLAINCCSGSADVSSTSSFISPSLVFLVASKLLVFLCLSFTSCFLASFAANSTLPSFPFLLLPCIQAKRLGDLAGS